MSSDRRFTAEDVRYMQMALDLARRANRHTHPNPMVGCVIVREGEVVGTGYHRKAGEPHAETLALQEAGVLAHGATVYVTLEPCAHHGRTPPCALALIDAGVARVVAAMIDPDPRVAGKGRELLLQAGVKVQVGLLEKEARELNRYWLHRVQTGRPVVLMKAAITLDGKMVTAGGDGRRITGHEAIVHAHSVRNVTDAILVGIGTVLKDDPQLTVRYQQDSAHHPTRIVLDSTCRIPQDARILAPENLALAPTVIATTDLASERRVDRLAEMGAEVIVFPAADGLVPLPALLDVLGARGVCSLLVEGGAQVHWSFISQSLYDHAFIYVAPKMVGGAQALGPIAGPGIPRMTDAWRLKNLRATPLGSDILLEADFIK